MSRVDRLVVAFASLIALAGIAAEAQIPSEFRGQPEGPRAPLSCGPYTDYQQPLDDTFLDSIYTSDFGSPFEVSEATVSGTTIVPIPGAYITGMRFWGLTFQTDPLQNCFVDDAAPYEFTFYEDSAGVPGSIVTSTTATPTRFDTGIVFVGSLTLQQWDVTFDPSVDLGAGTAAWISVRRTIGEDPDCGFAWANEGDGSTYDNRSYQDGGGGLKDLDMTMCLALEPIPVELQSFEVER